MLADLIGFVAISLVAVIMLMIASNWKSLFQIIITALIIRITLMLVGNYLIKLPDSSRDARTFETRAWEWAQEGFSEVLSFFPGFDALIITWIIAIPYSLFGRSILMAQSISLFFGVGSIILGCLLARKIWDEKVAIKVGWVLTLFPSLILYSVLTLREAYIYFFLLVAIYGVFNWIKKEDLGSMILAFLGFILASMFHGAMLIGAIIFLTIIVFVNLKTSFKLLRHSLVRPKSLIISILALIFLFFYVTNRINIPYLGTLADSLNFERLQYITNVTIAGDSSYPEWIVINSPVESIYKIPIRMIYFLFAPFPWQIQKISHLVGFIDGLLFISLFYLIFVNRKTILKDPGLKAILIVLFVYFVVFSTGVGNFGTGIRHRSKFVIELILLAAPFIPKFSFFRKNNINKYN